jgi:hypothetical protein
MRPYKTGSRVACKRIVPLKAVSAKHWSDFSPVTGNVDSLWIGEKLFRRLQTNKQTNKHNSSLKTKLVLSPICIVSIEAAKAVKNILSVDEMTMVSAWLRPKIPCLGKYIYTPSTPVPTSLYAPYKPVIGVSI